MRKSISRLAASITLGATLAVGTLAAPVAAHAEGKIRIAEQFGIVYLLLNVVRDQQLIEKHGKEEGLDIKVDWAQLSGGRRSTTHCCPARWISPAPASAHC